MFWVFSAIVTSQKLNETQRPQPQTHRSEPSLIAIRVEKREDDHVVIQRLGGSECTKSPLDGTMSQFHPIITKGEESSPFASCCCGPRSAHASRGRSHVYPVPGTSWRRVELPEAEWRVAQTGCTRDRSVDTRIEFSRGNRALNTGICSTAN